MKKIFLVLATLLWIGYWWRWYTCKICTTCGCNKSESVTSPVLEPETGFILFNRGDTTAMVQPGWVEYKDSLLSALTRNHLLTVEGQYIASEPNTSRYENMGVARANEIKRLFPDSIHTRIKLNSLLVSERPTMNGTPFTANSFSITEQSEKIEHVGDKTIVYFNLNSDQRIKDEEIENYLSGLAANHKNDRSSFVVTGHTDNTGSVKDNLKLGMKRANAIKSYLIAKGIAGERIRVKSLGDTDPIADNKTDEGRKKNRRTEIEILDKQ